MGTDSHFSGREGRGGPGVAENRDRLGVSAGGHPSLSRIFVAAKNGVSPAFSKEDAGYTQRTN